MDSITRWFTEARFGMFVHFGLYSVPAGLWKGETMGRGPYSEWIQLQANWPHGIEGAEYQALARDFNPTQFDAEQWISELVNAGMRYLVITSKHHDGFALWPSKVSKFNAVDATPFGRDILGELKAACDRHGVKFGLYYSHWLDWEHPGGGRAHESEEFLPGNLWTTQPSDEQFETYWQGKCLPQIAELCDVYKPVLFWFDTWGENSVPYITERRMDDLICLIKERNPTCLINSRIGTWGHSKGDAVVDFLSMGDNAFPERSIEQPWETSGTLNESWGYHQLDFGWKSASELVENIIRTTSNGGNYQLNVGPTGEGCFQPAAIRRLREIGAWMAANGTSIYGAGYAGLPDQKWGRITAVATENGRRLYLQVTKRPASGEVTVAGLTKLPKLARDLETNEVASIFQLSVGEDLVVSLPRHGSADSLPQVVVLHF